jgi:hypothetical protein
MAGSSAQPPVGMRTPRGALVFFIVERDWQVNCPLTSSPQKLAFPGHFLRQLTHVWAI